MPKNPLIGTPVTSPKKVEDLILLEWDTRYCRHAVELSAGDYVVGDLIANATVSTASSHGAAPSASDMLCLENITIESGETREVAALARGPALVNLDEVERATAEETDAELITRLADLLAQGVRFVREPAVQSTPDLFG